MPRKVIQMVNSLEPPAEFIEKVLTDNVEAKLEEFCVNLSIARAVWHQCRALVESPEFPEPFRSFEIKMNGREPTDDDCDGCDLWASPRFKVKGVFSIDRVHESLRAESLGEAIRLWPVVRTTYPKLLQQMPEQLAKITIPVLALLSEPDKPGPGPAA